MDHKLYVIAVHSNPAGYRRRAQLFRQFQQHMAAFPRVSLYCVELVYGAEALFEVTSADNPQHIQLRTDANPIWHKESMINVALRRLPADWAYVAWVDADLHFISADWAEKTIACLQKYPLCQPWSSAVIMGPEDVAVSLSHSFAWCFSQGYRFTPHKGKDPNVYGPYWHPGYAWAARRDFLEAMGGVFELGILGSGDRHMAYAAIGKARHSINKRLHNNYRQAVLNYEQRCLAINKGTIGVVKGVIAHNYHGTRANRRYNDRWQILIREAYDPLGQTYHDANGLLCVKAENTKILADIADYFRQRLEDD